MKRIISYIASVIVSLTFLLLMTTCGSGFDQAKASELLQKTSISSEEYDELLLLYETGMDDAIVFSKKEDKSLSEKDREEVLTVFAIGMRLSKDESNLTDAQKREFERINKIGTDAITK